MLWFGTCRLLSSSWYVSHNITTYELGTTPSKILGNYNEQGASIRKCCMSQTGWSHLHQSTPFHSLPWTGLYPRRSQPGYHVPHSTDLLNQRNHLHHVTIHALIHSTTVVFKVLQWICCCPVVHGLSIGKESEAIKDFEDGIAGLMNSKHYGLSFGSEAKEHKQ